MKRLSALFLMAICSFLLLSSCASDDEVITLNVYNWGEYISDGSEGSYNTNLEFENYFNTYLSEKYGKRVVVNYTTYPTNEDMYSKLVSGSGSYDVIFPSDYMIEKLIDEDMLRPLDWEGLKSESNFSSLDSDYTAQTYDPEDKYSVAYTYGRTGIIYNTTMVDEEDITGSWDLLWSPKYQGKILQFNNPRDAFGTAMYWKNIDINSSNPDDWNNALKLLKDQKPYLQGYVNDEIFDKMTGESAAIAAYFVGDFVTMYSENDNLAFYYPTEGSNVFVDAMCIPSSSKNPEIAMEYINFMLSPDAAIANALYLGYASPSRYVYNDDPALDDIYGEYNAEYLDGLTYDYFLDAEDEENPTDEEIAAAEEKAQAIFDLLYRVEDTENYSYDPIYHNFTPEIQRQVNSLWEELKIHGTAEVWIHITSALLVGTILVFAIYNEIVKKRRSRDYRMRDRALQKAKAAKKQ